MTLKDELHPWVRDNLTAIVNAARRHNLQGKEFFIIPDRDRKFLKWVSGVGSQITLNGDQPFEGLTVEELLKEHYGIEGSITYTITPRGFRAVDEDFGLPSRYDASLLIDVQVGDRYTVRDIINSQVAIGPSASAIASQVQADLGDENAELRAAIQELTRILEATSDRPTTLSALIQLLSALKNVPDAIAKVGPLIAAALRALGMLE